MGVQPLRTMWKGRLGAVRRSLHHHLSPSGGQVAPLMAAVISLFVFGGVLAVDIAKLYDAKARVQGAADLAALAAAQDLPRSITDPDYAAKVALAEATARDYLIANGFDPDRADVDAVVQTAYNGEADAVEVTLTLHEPWIFARFFGDDTAAVSGRAVGQSNQVPRDIVVVLDRSGSMCLFTHGGPMNNCPDPPGDPDGNGVADWQPFDTMRDAAVGFSERFTPTVGGFDFDRMSVASYSYTARVDQGLTSSFGANSAYSDAIDALVPRERTNIGHGIAVARRELEANGRPGAEKVIVLLTDGIANRYRSGGTDANPTFADCSGSGICYEAEEYARDEAQLAADLGYRIFTIGLTEAAGEDVLREVAQIGSGQFFDVDDPALLAEAFDEIADQFTVRLLE